MSDEHDQRVPDGRPWWIEDMLLCIGFLSRLPVPQPATLPVARPLMRAAWAFPVVGCLIGLAGAAVLSVAVDVNLPPLAAALLALAVTAALTGALHEDGLADFADGMGVGSDRERAIQVMRDSRTGVFGVLALVFATAMKAAALAAIVTAEPSLAVATLVAVHALARGGLPALTLALQPASGSGLGASAGRPTAAGAEGAAVVCIAVALAALPSGAGLAAPVAAGTAIAVVGWLAHRRLGGYTGDVLGAAEQAAETAGLLAVASMLAGG